MEFERIRRWLGGRSGRGEYWLSVLAVLALNIMATLVLGDAVAASLISMPVWLIIAARRLHDFNQTGWWGIIPFATGFVLGFAGGAGLLIAPLAKATVILLTNLITCVVIGTVPGNPLANRFGPPQGTRR